MKIKNVLIGLCLFSVKARAQISFGVNAGANMGQVTTKYDGKKDDGLKSSIGYIISGDVNIPLGESLLFQTGLQWESIRSKIETETVSSSFGYSSKYSFTGKSSLNYINVPVKIFYRMPVGSGSFMIGAGPYLGLGISGKNSGTEKSEFTYNGTTTTQVYDYSSKTTFGSADTATKRTNFGVGLNLAYTLASNIRFSAYANLGLGNISNEDKTNTKTTTYGITIGYVFGNKNEEE